MNEWMKLEWCYCFVAWMITAHLSREKERADRPNGLKRSGDNNLDQMFRIIFSDCLNEWNIATTAINLWDWMDEDNYLQVNE